MMMKLTGLAFAAGLATLMGSTAMAEPVTARDTLLSHMLRFAPAATMFYSGTLCGLSPKFGRVV